MTDLNALAERLEGPKGRVKRRIEEGAILRDRLHSRGDHLAAIVVADLIASLRASSALNQVLHRDLQAALKGRDGADDPGAGA